jgi:Zn-dependent protease
MAFAEAQPGGLGVGDGLLWLLLIFLCVLVHELAHSLVARRQGAIVHSIELLPIGGVSRIEGIPERWSDELIVAAVGPLASLGLAVLAAGAAAVTGTHLLPVNIYGGALLPRLVWLNLLVGLFNLLPAFPMDGGRVLRATLERRRDLESATHVAARLGRSLGGVMVVAGMFWNLWLILIGVFVFLGATQEEASTTAHTRLRGRQVRQFMRTPAATIDARDPLPVVRARWPGPYIVTVDGLYYGLADGDTLRAGGGAVVADVADREAPTLAPDEDLGRSALDRLVGSGYQALAVVDKGTVVGVLMADDLASWLGARAGARGSSGR